MSDNSAPLAFDINGIIRHQRNRYPVLLIDRVTAVDPGKSASAVKCFTYNEWFFPGHFDDDPNVPGFVQTEVLAQTFLMTFLSIPEYQGMKAHAAAVNNVKFRRKIIPGDVLKIEATLKSFKRGLAIGSAESWVEGEAACSGDFVVAVPDILNRYKPKA